VKDTLESVPLPAPFNYERFRRYVHTVFAAADWHFPDGRIAAYKDTGAPNITTVTYNVAAFPPDGGSSIRVSLYQDFDCDFLADSVHIAFEGIEHAAAKALLAKIEAARTVTPPSRP
jgi:hypothetical protein